MLVIDGSVLSYEIAIRCLSRDLTDDKLRLIQLMARWAVTGVNDDKIFVALCHH